MKIYTIGGYEKVGGNMTAVETDGEIVLLDMGVDIERLIEQGEDIEDMKTIEAIESGVVPDDSEIKKERKKVSAIITNHGHQDHVRGIPKLAGAYDCPIIATPYTADIVERFIENDSEHVSNEIVRMEAGDTYQISENIELEFINITHSIPHSVISLLRTSEGNLVYSLDFKLDDHPTLGNPVDYDRLKKLGEERVDVYIVDCTRSDDPGRAKTERETKLELEKIISEAYGQKRGVIVTTFSSHIARLNNIIEANDGGRKIVMLGRSLKEYTKDAKKQDLIDLSNIEIASFRGEVEKLLREISKNKSEYLLVTTGNQGEPNAILPRIAAEDYPYGVGDGDMVIFSSVTIPTSTNEMNREYLKRTLRQNGAKLKLDVHSHGHAMKEDHKDMVKMLDPETVIPAHGNREKLISCAQIAREEGVESVQISGNGGIIRIN